MAGFTSRDDIINEITVNGKQDLWNFFKTAANVGTAATWATLWTGAGTPGAGSAPATTPGTAYASDPTTPVNGSIYFPDHDPDKRYLLSFGAMAQSALTLMLYERLAAVANVPLNATGAKTINSAALTRYTGADAILNEVWLELTAANTTTAPNVTLTSYTSADGSTAQAGPAFTLPAAALAIGTMVQVPFSASKQGVRSVQTLTVNTAGTAGIANLVILRPIARIPLQSGQWNEYSFLDDTLGLPRIFDDACLALAYYSASAVTPNVWGTLNCAYG